MLFPAGSVVWWREGRALAWGGGGMHVCMWHACRVIREEVETVPTTNGVANVVNVCAATGIAELTTTFNTTAPPAAAPAAAAATAAAARTPRRHRDQTAHIP